MRWRTTFFWNLSPFLDHMVNKSKDTINDIKGGTRGALKLNWHFSKPLFYDFQIVNGFINQLSSWTSWVLQKSTNRTWENWIKLSNSDFYSSNFAGFWQKSDKELREESTKLQYRAKCIEEWLSMKFSDRAKYIRPNYRGGRDICWHLQYIYHTFCYVLGFLL